MVSICHAELGLNNLIELDLNSPLVVIGIPAYNEEKTIEQIIVGAQQFSQIVVVCDDGSCDLTGKIAERLGAVVIYHKKNLGYGAALQSLFNQARELNADILVTLDSDGQHNPAEIPLLVQPIEQGVAEVVLGSRFKDSNGTADMPLYRQLGVKVITRIATCLGKNGVSDAQSGFRAYSRHALKCLRINDDGMGASLELLQAINKNGLKVSEVPISCKYSRSEGVETSSKNPLTHGFGLLISIIRLIAEDRPLLILGVPGVVSITVGVFFGIWLLSAFAKTTEIISIIAIASMVFTLMGCFLITSSIKLNATQRLKNIVNELECEELTMKEARLQKLLMERER